MKNKKQKFQSVALIFLLALAISFPLRIMAATTGSDYWKNYFSDVEKKAVQKNAEKYTLSEIKKKSKDWRNIFTGFNIKNGSISSDDIKNIDAGKVKNLDDAIADQVSGKLSTSGGTLSGLLTWASGQTFDAGNLTGTYAALDGSQITGITASQIDAVPYSGATGQVNLNEKNLINVGNVGIGTTAPLDILHIVKENSNAIQFIDVYGSGTPSIIGRRARGTIASPSGPTISDSLFSISARGYGETGFSSLSRVVINLRPSESWTDTAQGALITFETTATGGTSRTEKMRLSANGGLSLGYIGAEPGAGNAIFSGNIGIGTTGPGQKLTIVGGSVLLDNNVGYMGADTGGTGVTLLKTTVNDDTILNAKAVNFIAFAVDQVEKMRMSATGGLSLGDSTYFTTDPGAGSAIFQGNVGIGTTNPVASLDVNGTAKLKKYTAEPFACDATHDGTTALTSTYRTCVCNGGTTTWVYTSDGTTTCVWQ